MQGLSVERRQHDGMTLLVLAGEFDLAAEPLFRSGVDAVVGEPVLVLDLTQVSFMDSTGLRLLLETDARVRENAGRCVIVQGSGSVHRLIEQGLLAARLEVVSRLDDVTP